MFNSTLNPRSGKRERLLVSTTVAQFTPANYTIAVEQGATKHLSNDTLARGAILQIVGATNVYWTTDGSTPSPSVGFLATAGDFIFLDTLQKLKNFKAIRVTTDTSIEAQFLYGN